MYRYNSRIFSAAAFFAATTTSARCNLLAGKPARLSKRYHCCPFKQLRSSQSKHVGLFCYNYDSAFPLNHPFIKRSFNYKQSRNHILSSSLFLTPSSPTSTLLQKKNKILSLREEGVFRNRQEHKLFSTSSSNNNKNNSKSKSKRSKKYELVISNSSDDDIDDNILIENKTINWLKNIVIGLNLCPFAEKPFREKDKVKVHILRRRRRRRKILGGNDDRNPTDVKKIGNDDDDDIDNDDEYLKSILYTTLLESIERKNKPGTTLIVMPNLYPNNFYKFLDVLSIFEEEYIHNGDNSDDGNDNNDDSESLLYGYIQIAPFHPQFVFNDEKSYDDNSSSSNSNDSGRPNIENYTNRSPYPIFHILREDEVSKAVDKIPDGDASKVWKRNVKVLNELEEEIGYDTLHQYIATGGEYTTIRKTNTNQVKGNDIDIDDDEITEPSKISSIIKKVLKGNKFKFSSSSSSSRSTSSQE